MSFIFSRALVEAFSPASFEETDASAQSSASPTPRPCLWHDKTTERFPLSRFGMTCAPLTEGRGEELLMSLLADFRAKTSAPPVPAKASKASEAAYGPKWLGSFARYSPSESKWKTAQCSLLGDSDEFSETWPRWGSMRNGESFLRQIPALPICASESGFWQTPVADDAIERAAGKWNSRGEPKLSAEVKLWPTPTASLADKGGRVTPRKGREGGTLIEAVSSRMWPTPAATDYKGSPSAQRVASRQEASTRGVRLPEQLARDGQYGQLNPEWVEWLMGWPIGHTALEPLETAKYREWLRQHSPCSSDEPTA